MTPTQQKDFGAQWRAEWADANKIRAPGMKDASPFYRNIEAELDLARSGGGALALHPNTDVTDVSSCDILGLGHSGALREEFLKELAAHPNFYVGAGGTRLLNGTTSYQMQVESELAELMGYESALVVHSGCTANQAIWSTVPRTGDVIVYDELSHATALMGMKISLALEQRPFKHNDVEHFIEVLESVKESMPLVRDGKRCVIIGVESWYSMNGDICPLRELIAAANDIFPHGNAQFVVDEAHSYGVCGPDGTGFVRKLGLTDQVAITMATFTKALACAGGIILSNNTIRRLLINQCKTFICSTSPSFPMLATCRASIRLTTSRVGQQARDHVYDLVRFYLDTLTSHPTYKRAHRRGMLDMPHFEDDGMWHEVPITHLVPLWCRRPNHALYLAFHLTRAGFNPSNIAFPIVGKGEDRVRLTLHAYNTREEMVRLVESIMEFTEEMFAIEASGDKTRLPAAARLAYALFDEATAEGGHSDEEEGGKNTSNSNSSTNSVNGEEEHVHNLAASKDVVSRGPVPITV